MMNIGVTAYSARPKWIAAFMLLVSIWLAAGCSTGDFSRGQAVTAISEAANYKQAAATSIDIGSLPDSNARAYQLSKEDTAEAAAIRAKRGFQKETAADDHR